MSSLFLVSCFDFFNPYDDYYDDDYEDYDRPSPDSRFTGCWSISINHSENPFIDKGYTHKIYTFYNNNTFKYNSTKIMDGIIIYEYSTTYEWKRSKGIYYFRSYRYGNDYNDDYRDWQIFDIEYVDKNEIIIDGLHLDKC